jgi:hypothetical protein
MLLAKYGELNDVSKVEIIKSVAYYNATEYKYFDKERSWYNKNNAVSFRAKNSKYLLGQFGRLMSLYGRDFKIIDLIKKGVN